MEYPGEIFNEKKVDEEFQQMCHTNVTVACSMATARHLGLDEIHQLKLTINVLAKWQEEMLQVSARVVEANNRSNLFNMIKEYQDAKERGVKQSGQLPEQSSR